MKNWLGQEITVGDWVYKARRDGNGTAQMMGKVISVNEEAGTARVQWWADPMNREVYNFETRTRKPRPSEDGTYMLIRNPEGAYSFEKPNSGTNDIDSLIKIAECVGLDRLRDTVVE